MYLICTNETITSEYPYNGKRLKHKVVQMINTLLILSFFSTYLNTHVGFVERLYSLPKRQVLGPRRENPS